MNIRNISTNIGKALIINALFMFISVIISIVYGFDSGFTPLLISGILTFLTGAFPMIFYKSRSRDSLKDGYATLVLAWLLSFIFGMLPYILWGGEFTIMNAWFESVSGYTTTGSTIITDIEALPHSLLFWRSSTQFIGGMGVIIFLLAKSSKTIKTMLAVYIGLAAAETLCLWIAGMTPFDAVNHAFSTVSTGGFSTHNLSITHYDSVAIEIVIMIFMALSAINFGVIFAIFAQRSLKPLKGSVTRYYLAAIVILSILITGSLMLSGGYGSFGDALRDSSFQTVSFMSTTGFGQSDIALWPAMAGILLIFAAIHGGCTGSTAGGLKADRVLVAGKAAARELRLKLSPYSVLRIKTGRTYIPEDTVSTVFLFIVLYIFVLFASFVAVMACGVEISDAFSGTVASIGNVGCGSGSLGTMSSCSAYPEAAKFIYTLDMFLGRLEIFPILIAISMILKRKQS